MSRLYYFQGRKKVKAPVPQHSILCKKTGKPLAAKLGGGTCLCKDAEHCIVFPKEGLTGGTRRATIPDQQETNHGDQDEGE